MSRARWTWFGRVAPPIRERWRDRWETSSPSAVPAQPIERRAGALFSQAVQRDPLPRDKLVAIAERLRHRPRRRRAARRALFVRLAAGLSLLIVGGALAATATHYFRSTSRPEKPTPASSSHASPSSFRRSRSAPVRSTAGALAVTDPTREPAAPAAPLRRADPPPEEPSPPPPSRAIRAPAARLGGRESPVGLRRQPPAPGRLEEGPDATGRLPPFEARGEPSLPAAPASAVLPAAPALPFAPAAPSTTPLADESRLIMSALTALRRHDDAALALGILDQHDLRFPRGDLAEEATLARVEALVKVKRSGEALALLEARGPAGRGDNQRKLLLARAELRAAAGHCAAALRDLDHVLRGKPPEDALTERALWGRAACRASGGQPDGARADLEAYLRTFPSGRFAARASAALGGDQPGPRR